MLASALSFAIAACNLATSSGTQAQDGAPLLRREGEAIVSADVARPLQLRWSREGASITRARSRAGATMHLARFGRPGALHELAPPAQIPSISGTRAELARQGIVEWYEPRIEGIEQGFRIDERPGGVGALVLDVELAGVQAAPSPNAGEIDLRQRSADGSLLAPELRYGALTVEDSAGTRLAAMLTVVDHGAIRISITDDDARYPINVDPLVWGLRTKLTVLSEMSQDYLGWSVAVDGDTIMAGAEGRVGYAGGATSFRRGDAGWSEEATLVSPYPGAYVFGTTVALDGDFAFIGSGGPSFVYRRTGARWDVFQDLPFAGLVQGFDYYVVPVAEQGGTTAILNREYPFDGGTPSDLVLLSADAGSWTVSSSFATTDAVLATNGGAVAVQGDRVAVGTGTSAIVYRRNAAGAYAVEARLLGDETQDFGAALAFTDDTLLVGSPVGRAVYVYVVGTSGWSLQQKLAGAAHPEPSNFGFAVTLVGDTAWIGDPQHNVGGEVFRYQRSGTTWSLGEEILNPGTSLGQFGRAVAATASVAVIGAPYEANGRGAVYVYELGDALGVPCTSAEACLSGFCVQGVCCDTACASDQAGSCLSCNGPAPGTCSVAVAGTACRPSVDSCDLAESCDGTHDVCPFDRVVADGTPCVGGYCTAGACEPTGGPAAGDANAPANPDYQAGGCTTGRAPLHSRDAPSAIFVALGTVALLLRRYRRGGRAFGLAAVGLAAVGVVGAQTADRFVLESGGIRATVTAAGTELEDVETGRAFELSFLGVGRESDIQLPALSSPRSHGDRLERTGDGIVEWYSVAGKGIEHGFDIEEAPRGDRHREPLLVRLSARSFESPQGLDDSFVLEDGDSRLSYGQVEVRDHANRRLPSRLAVVADTIELRVDDTDAEYPIVIDPLVWRERQTLHAPAGAPSTFFGTAVSVSVDRLVVGSPAVSGGIAQVFVRNGNDWNAEATLVAPDSLAVQFGASVSVSGAYAAVGAPAFGDSGAGAVYLYERTGSTWALTAKLTNPEVSGPTLFGASVSLDGDELAVGAPVEGVGPDGDPLGIVFLYQHAGTTWSLETRVQATDETPSHYFGDAVALQGDTLLVGASAPSALIVVSDSDTAWFYGRTGGTWSFARAVTAIPVSLFGSSVALDGDTAAIGEQNADYPEGLTALGGSTVRTYVRQNGVWQDDQLLAAPVQAGYDSFGGSVALVGNRLLVGSVFGTDARGAALLFERTNNTWLLNPDFQTQGLAADDQYGASVALLDDMALVGAPGIGTVTALYLGLEGNACTSGDACASGQCIDGVCCSSACGGGDTSDCLACSVAAGAAQDGTCGPAGPRVCRAARSGCDVSESCDGVRTDCPVDAVEPNGLACAGGSCSGGECLARVPIPALDAGTLNEGLDSEDSSGCAVVPSKAQKPIGDGLLLPWLTVLGLVGARRRRPR